MSAAGETPDVAVQPDVMNDPAFDAPSNGQRKKSLDEPDTCRICRADASAAEPLFYPCKCSGSIKFVHQNCLMEWLSHSQKKHCELCKTPFRFTKLYHPNMPSTVPPLRFLRQVVIHFAQSVISWSRMHLVVFVWLCWLPWSMRAVWRGLFWLGDGGWITWARMEEAALQAAKERTDQLATEGTSPIPRDFAVSTIISRWAEALQIGLADGETFRFGLAKRLARHFTTSQIQNITDPSIQATASTPSNLKGPSYRSSWLSDVGFLKSLTRYSILNNLFVDMLEGQLITLFVVIAFILVFLIREWVVQQQPIINAGGGPEDQRPVLALEGNNIPPNAPNGAGNEDAEDRNAAADAGPADNAGPLDPTAQDFPTDLIAAIDASGSNPSSRSDHATHGNTVEGSDTPLPQQRPSMPDREIVARAAEIRRTLEEYGRASGNDWPGLRTLTDLWTRGHNRPTEVIKIIEDEGRASELDWIIEIMKRLEDTALPAEANGHVENVTTPEHTDAIDDHQIDNSSPIPQSHRSSLTSGDDAHKDVLNEAHEVEGHDTSLNVEAQGSGSPDTTSHEENQSATATPDSDTAESSVTRYLPLTHSIPTVSHPTSSSNEDEPEFPADASNNPFHPEYARPLPSNLRESPSVDEPTLAAELPDGNAIDTVPEQSQQAAGHLDASVGARPDRTFSEKIIIWLWGEPRQPVSGNHEQVAGDVELVVRDLANEAPFVPVENGRPRPDHAQPERDDEVPAAGPEPEAVAAAVQAGLDPNDAEGMEEIEDIEGVMELVGMRGPIAGLVQNGMFSAVLVSLTIFITVWIPYMAGKLFLVIVTNPISLLVRMPLWWINSSIDSLWNIAIFLAGNLYFWISMVISFLCSPIWKLEVMASMNYGDTALRRIAKEYADDALRRLLKIFLVEAGSLSDADIPAFSIIAHESLKAIQERISYSTRTLLSNTIAVCISASKSNLSWSRVTEYLAIPIAYKQASAMVMDKSKLALAFIDTMSHEISARVTSFEILDLLYINVSAPQARTQPLDYTLARWDTKDRALAILFGYIFFALLGVLYLRLGSFFQGKKNGGRVEGVVADVLYQAGGVLKVILIISIEMIVFPLYCGFLLDAALLPLFRNVTIMSRLDFMIRSPYTSLFVHWFVGTCYMFHFALFVSMCRKIMRAGVLYFIRDPDDPTFHPVRDVLERNVFTQLFKIAFSALVYGGLVIVCLGGVVWGISAGIDGVFPIHWSSNEPVLEFPVDLLFYNFLMPLAVKVSKPSDGLTKMYGWWFRKCARGLRLSHFLFGDKRLDEEGRHVRRTWSDVFAGKKGDVNNPVRKDKDGRQPAVDEGLDAYFLRDGTYIRTPASDQVRIPKGARTFLEVDEDGNRVDGKEDDDQGLHGRRNDHFSTVYIPPRFRLRISAFIGLLWLFAATTGVCITVIPLVLGRYLFTTIFPAHPRMNDVYAFSIGINLIGATTFLALNARFILKYLHRTLVVPAQESTVMNIARRISYYTLRLLRVVYTYTAFALVLPSLLALVMELYFFVPLHTYFGQGPTAGQHTIYFIQSWTLGVLYLQVVGRLILWREHSRPAIALRNVVREGWTDPDARLATRGFIFPGTLLLVLLLTMPLALASLLVNSSALPKDVKVGAIYRYSYPAILAQAVGVLLLWYAGKAFREWKRRIRDEIYLIGERLHNFGEGKGTGGRRVAV
ncbi:MAG: hypothetical protein Q9220_006645 [cf. Caloplaca sp. 1 TL-2023]